MTSVIGVDLAEEGTDRTVVTIAGLHSLPIGAALDELALARARKERVEGILAKHRMEFEENYRELFDLIVTEQSLITQYSAYIREQALAHYRETGEKSVDQVSVRCNVELEYDLDRALEWAKTEFRVGINPETLNVSAFEKLVRGRVDDKTLQRDKTVHPTGFDWVTANEKPVAAIAKDLTSRLPAELRISE